MIVNAITKKTYACFEPTIDYCVIKFPRFPFDKFVKAKKTLGTQMKATGEVMAISNNFEEAILSVCVDCFSNYATQSIFACMFKKR